MHHRVLLLCSRQCKEPTWSTETFLAVVQSSANLDELGAVKSFLEQEIVRQRSFDTGGENGLSSSSSSSSSSLPPSLSLSLSLRLRA